jgi:selenocysteine lyase/cysteine desulfurase
VIDRLADYYREENANIRRGVHLLGVAWQMLCDEKGARMRVVPMTDTGEERRARQPLRALVFR